MNSKLILRKKELLLYYVLTNIVFWVLLGITGLAISLSVSQTTQIILKNICAWSSTFVILIMFKKFYPNKNFFQHIRDNFRQKIKWQSIGSVILIQLLVYGLAVFTYTLINKVNFSSMEFVALPSLFSLIVINITSGPLGEELGWRGFAYNELRGKYSSIKTAVIIGLAWGLWHIPLWFLSGYQGIDLVLYILIFMVSIIKISILISIFYEKTRNLFIPILIHFLFNFLLNLVKADLIQLFFYTAIFNALAIGLILIIQNFSLGTKAKQFSRDKIAKDPSR